MHLQSKLSAEEYFRAVEKKLSPGYRLKRKAGGRFALSSDEDCFFFRILVRVPRVIAGAVRDERDGCAVIAQLKISAIHKALYIVSALLYAALICYCIVDSFHNTEGFVPVLICSLLFVVYPLIIAYFSRGNVDMLKEQLTRVL